MTSRRANWLLAALLALMGGVVSPLPAAGTVATEHTVAWTERAHAAELRRCGTSREISLPRVRVEYNEPGVAARAGYNPHLFQRPPPASSSVNT